MATKDQQPDPANTPAQPGPGAIKDPEDWKTGGEPITDAQMSYLQTLAQQAGEQLDVANLTKADAAEHINRLQEVTGREGGATNQAGQ